ncbi:electron transport complex subunit RsxC, partial [bacterium]|nr:electron transport complex subunit RsxC [bacterium]
MLGLLKRGFKGGVHPPENKHLTESQKIEEIPIPKEVIIPVQQHIGRASEAVVEKGDKVKAGDIISKSGGFVSVPCHSSVSGTVKAVEPFIHPLGEKIPSVIIESDGEDAYGDSIQFNPQYMEISPDEMKTMIHDAGVAGMGGATFPTHVKLSPPEGMKIDTAILNGAECEPYLTSDHRVMLEKTEEVIEGFRIIMKILNVQTGIIGIENNKPNAVLKMKEAASKYPEIVVVSLKVKYPQGAEKQLIYALTKRIVPAGKLPMEVGCVVQNVGTAQAVYNAVAYKRPLIDRVVTVGGSITHKKNLLVRIGTPIRNLIEYCGEFEGDAKKIIMGGPMMGFALHSLDTPVIKGTSGILMLNKGQTGLGKITACLNCGSCVEVCPMNLLPNQLANLAEKERFDEAEEFNAMDCIECGCCAYTCPAKINLVQNIKYAKSVIMK